MVGCEGDPLICIDCSSQTGQVWVWVCAGGHGAGWRRPSLHPGTLAFLAPAHFREVAASVWSGTRLRSATGGEGVVAPLARCDDNPACRWYTWDNREDLCYLKSGRGYLRNRWDWPPFGL